MTKLTANSKSNVFINNTPIESISFNNLKTHLFNVSNDVFKKDVQLSNFSEIKSKLSILKANIDNNNLTDKEFRNFVKTLF
jgi:hypothetical protein